MRVLITNSVPLNGGDEALLRAAIRLLRDQFPQSSIKVLCKDVDICRRYHPDLDLDTDLEYIRYPQTATSQRLFKIRLMLNDFVGSWWASRITIAVANKDERRVIEWYRSCDVVVSCPGGFLHDFYDVEHRFMGFELAMELGKPVIILGQSVGPFWKDRSRQRAKQVLSRLDAILIREERSLRHLQECGVDTARVSVTSDIAFYWRRMAPQLFTIKRGPVHRIAVCFRQWREKAGSAEVIVAKAAQLCRHLLDASPERELVFLSTCQGIPEYIDDSKIARAVVAALPEPLKARCIVDGHRHGPEQLIRQYSQVDAYIGMRLHGAILAMLGGTAAMAIAYEEKTPGIYAGLGLDAFQVDHRERVNRWIACADLFVHRIAQIRDNLPETLDAAAAKVQASQPLVQRIAENRRKRAVLSG